jgi:hypothetical protein
MNKLFRIIDDTIGCFLSVVITLVGVAAAVFLLGIIVAITLCIFGAPVPGCTL